jgi:hypothetical protein
MTLVEFRLQAGAVVGGKWDQGAFDRLFDAANFTEAESKGLALALNGDWVESGTCLRVTGDANEHRCSPEENT